MNPRGSRRPLTARAHAAVAARISPGALAVDATAGNGHDTRFLAEAVGATGRVWAFDVQTPALEATARRLQAAGLTQRVQLIHAGHEHLAAHLPPAARGRLAAVLFNLGYLPGGDHGRITQPETTLAALEAALAWLHPRGLVSVLAYRGHDGGEAEYEALQAWLSRRGPAVRCLHRESPSANAPVLLLLERGDAPGGCMQEAP
ncbi:tRNA (mnm(5)s(2)U34)-methyltransferase [Ectothiorhodospira mobilis]|uniref:tRNA (mnm(5)s(2)U34)-methyltransferase n=1 Tax=Ectothiorhodospira mobilis TaxID=195064 RepID=UPI001EE7F095|nr:class I SAM-dependent methyltransferase [Ectothiorhodospira mobilis]MCG5534844.1 methyltransferase domain-containing protein [Ectothiorhodospira mobilis]